MMMTARKEERHVPLAHHFRDHVLHNLLLADLLQERTTTFTGTRSVIPGCPYYTSLFSRVACETHALESSHKNHENVEGDNSNIQRSTVNHLLIICRIKFNHLKGKGSRPRIVEMLNN